ncbi:MAG: ArdC-like ssDNA-binding domain-containing protein [Syntrophorhabdus sp.]|jgi:hypothetical protein
MEEKKKRSYGEQQDKMLQEIQEAIQKIRTSHEYKQFLGFINLMHPYSFHNLVLIWTQCPHATYVGGMKKVWNRVGRRVKKGERSIKILRPVIKNIPRKADDNDFQEDLFGNEITVFDEPDNSQERESRRVVVGYRVASVFDISQTEGRDIPEICRPIVGETELYILFSQYVRENGYEVIEQEDLGAHGLTDYQSIRIEANNSQAQKLKTLVHEYGHNYLNHDNTFVDDRPAKELQAETVAYLVCKDLGLDTSNYSFEYLTHWSEGMDEKKFAAVVSFAINTARQIIQDFRNYACLTSQIEKASEEPFEQEERRVA